MRIYIYRRARMTSFQRAELPAIIELHYFGRTRQMIAALAHFQHAFSPIFDAFALYFAAKRYTVPRTACTLAASAYSSTADAGRLPRRLTAYFKTMTGDYYATYPWPMPLKALIQPAYRWTADSH